MNENIYPQSTHRCVIYPSRDAFPAMNWNLLVLYKVMFCLWSLFSSNNSMKESPAQKKAKVDISSPQIMSAGGRQLVSLGSGLKDARIDASSTSITLSRPTGKALKKTTISSKWTSLILTILFGLPQKSQTKWKR